MAVITDGLPNVLLPQHSLCRVVPRLKGRTLKKRRDQLAGHYDEALLPAWKRE